MGDPQVRAVKERVELVADPKLMEPDAPRSGQVEVTLRDGRTVRHLTRHAPGTRENPLDTERLNSKVRDLMASVLGDKRTEAVIRHINALEELGNVRELRPFLTLQG
jgi:2-methylcitrate dehydratase PrpD